MFIAKVNKAKEIQVPAVSVASGLTPEIVASRLEWAQDSWRLITDEEAARLQEPTVEEKMRIRREYSASCAQFRKNIMAPGGLFIKGWMYVLPVSRGFEFCVPDGGTWFYRAMGICEGGFVRGRAVRSALIAGGTRVAIPGVDFITAIGWRLY